MLFQRINRTDPEKIFIVVKNSWSTASLTNGQAVNWDFLTDSDGVGVSRPTARATNAGVAVAGIAAETIASGEYGLLQVYGYHSAVRSRSATSANPNIEKGTPLGMNAAGSVFCLESVETSSTAIIKFPCGFALAANAVWTTTAIATFLKCM
jgi:hypothetical protein